MAEDGNGFNCENGSSKNQTSTSEERRRASKEANHVWAPLKRRKAPRGNPKLKRWSVSEASSSKSRRTNATIAESASKEFSHIGKYRRRSLAGWQLKLKKSDPSILFSCTFPQLNPSFYRSGTHLTHVCLGISGRHSVGHLYVVQALLHHYRTHLACVQRGTPIP